jgi:peptide deformylase
MDERFADELTASGDLTPDWRPSFLAVPRQQFIPDTIWEEVYGFLRPVYRAENPERWLELASGEDFVITQVDDGCPAGPGDAGGVATSSASMPKMVALMLKHLDVQGGERVFEIGTGAGWNAALLAHRLGADRVTTIEIDAEVATHARKALSDAGFGEVIAVVGNGSWGHLPQAPYDRVIATASCHTVPYAWVEQTRPGGRIVTPWGSQYCNFGLLALTVNDDGTAVWGNYTSITAESMPFPTAIHIQETNDRKIFSWSTENPPPHARYRLEWHFRNQPRETPPNSPKPSAIMKSLGIAQDDDPVLRCTARPFALPEDAEDARHVIAELHSVTHRAAQAHKLGQRMGIAAPQIGIERAAAIVRPPGGDDVITLLNPRIIETSDDTDEHYEGCLSFFDVRCLVPRPLVIHVEHQDITGDRRITIFERGIARLVAHEVDHLHGILCKDHMREGVRPIPIEQYRGTGTNWRYPAPTTGPS